jgi:uncharacterized protein (TIGR02246 family)
VDAIALAGETADGFATAWNKHDMEALGQLFFEDADFVNVVGLHMRGRESIKEGHGAAHAGPYTDSTLDVEVDDAKEFVPGAVIAHWQTQLEGDARAPGQIRRTLMTVILERRASTWKIVAAHNTGIAPAVT